MNQQEKDQLNETCKELSKRCLQFKCLELPGQPQGMHMGTSYLVNDLESALIKATAYACRQESTKNHAAEILDHLDRIQIGAEQAALESDADKRHTYLQKITKAKAEVMKIVSGE